MLGNDQSPILRRAEAASSALDKAAANPGNPFEMMKARRDAETVVAELTKVANDDRALAIFAAAQGQPRPLYDERPGAAPSLTQSSNISSSPRGTRVPVTPSGGSTTAPGIFPQSSNYRRPSGDDPFAEERRYAETPDTSDPLDTERVLAQMKLLGRVDPPKNYSDGERKTMAQSGHAMPDGSLAIGRAMDIPVAAHEWKNGDQSAEGAAHIKWRAKALNAEFLLPPEFSKYARIGSLRKN
jgi:hypothetical protein